MEEHNADTVVAKADNKIQKLPIDPLRRIWVPIEKRTPNGTTVFQTHDRQVYARLQDGSIRRATPKVNGKEARKARKRAR